MADLDVNKVESEALVGMLYKQVENLNNHIDQIQSIVNQIIQDPTLAGDWKVAWQNAQKTIDDEQKNMIAQFADGSKVVDNITQAYKDVDKVASQYFV